MDDAFTGSDVESADGGPELLDGRFVGRCGVDGIASVGDARADERAHGSIAGGPTLLYAH